MTEAGDGTTGRGAVSRWALVLLTLGSLVSWVGWVGGVLLLWASDRWTRRDKLLGTLVLPGGLLPAWAFARGPATTTCVSLVTGSGASIPRTCDPMPLPLPMMVLAQTVLVLAPLVVVAVLGWRVRRTPAA
jgi:hypothetical protein